MSTRSNPYGEDDSDLLRRFAMAEDGTARYPAADWAESSNVMDLERYRRLRAGKSD